MIAAHMLVGHDGSRDAATAFGDARDLAVLARAYVTVVSVARPPEPPTGVETQRRSRWQPRHDEDLFQSLRCQAQERNVTLETHVLAGRPADQIPKSTARYGADGHRARSTVRDWVSGSTSGRVSARATCPLLVVRAR